LLGEFNLPARPAPEAIDIDDSKEENENEQAHNSDDKSIQAPKSNKEEETQTDLGALPPLFYRLHPPVKANNTPDKIPLIQVKQEAAAHSVEDQHYVHVYLQASLHIKQKMPDWPGLMKVHNFSNIKSDPMLLSLCSHENVEEATKIPLSIDGPTQRLVTFTPFTFRGIRFPATQPRPPRRQKRRPQLLRKRNRSLKRQPTSKFGFASLFKNF
jgi:hypothetical protein